MITLEDYFKTVEDLRSPENDNTAQALLDKVNALLDYLKTLGIKEYIDKETGSQISGNGSGGGGARRKNSTEGRPQSSHKEFRGVDVADPQNTIDGILTDAMLLKFGLYREAAQCTISWCHLTDRSPKSGKRTFLP